MPHIATCLIMVFSCLLIKQISSTHIIFAIHDSPSLTKTEFGLIKAILRDAPKTGSDHIFSVITFDSFDAYLQLNQSKISGTSETMDFLQQGNSSSATAPNLASVFALIQKHFPDGKKILVTFLFDSPASTQMAQEAWSKIKKTTFLAVFVKANATANAAATIQFLTKIANNKTNKVLVFNHITEVNGNKIWDAAQTAELLEMPKYDLKLCPNRSCLSYCLLPVNFCPQPEGSVCSNGNGNKDHETPIGGGGDGNGGHKHVHESGSNGKSKGKKSFSEAELAGIAFSCVVFFVLVISVIAYFCHKRHHAKPYKGTRTQLARQMLSSQGTQKSSTPSFGPHLSGFSSGPLMENYSAFGAGLDSHCVPDTTCHPDTSCGHDTTCGQDSACGQDSTCGTD